jgi:lipopolysaccharide export system permease protein
VITTTGRYVSRTLLAHLAMTFVGFVALLQIFDLLNSADDVIGRHGSWSAVARYAMLRLPELAAFILPFAMLIATLLMLAKLARNNEIMALKSSGLSFYRLLLSLIPVTLLIGALHFLISDQVVPRTAQALHEWDAAADASQAAQGNQRRGDDGPGVWVRDGSSFIHLDSIVAEGTELRGVTINERDDNVLTRRLLAKRAVFDSTGWRLFDVQILSLVEGADRRPELLAEMPWQTSLTPGHLADLAADPAKLSLAEVWRFVASPDVGSRPVDFYQTWLLRKIAIPFVTLMMVLLAAPVAQGMQRHGGLGTGLAVGVGIGFLYFVADGLLLALGEIGTIPPVVAAWSPTVLFGAIGVSVLLKIEGY